MFSFGSRTKLIKGLAILACATQITACGGGGGSSDTGNPASIEAAGTLEQAAAASINAKPLNRAEAARFLTQATFGPTYNSTTELMEKGFTPWLEDQFAKSPTGSYRAYWLRRNAIIKSSKPTGSAGINELQQAFWQQALAGQDQLRQRVALALSEIFVVSGMDGCGDNHPEGAASYFDMLREKAFGSYRDLLKNVALHPIMGCYLSHLKNQKADGAGRVPDENFAREVMQLFSIGLVKLNMDGSVVTANGQPVETYSATDVSELAKVFTGWSLACEDTTNTCFLSGKHGSASATSISWTQPMQAYPQYHDISMKKFLGATVPAQSVPDPMRSLDAAINILDSHPNVAPFISKQLIQRLVTSNPSPQYVHRVASAFQNSGHNLKATVTAILMDPEARDITLSKTNMRFGKIREPLLRLSALLRAYDVTSATGDFLLYMWNINEAFGQAPFYSPSVFNFFRPGYSPPNSAAAEAGMVSPEMQIVQETTAASYVNYMKVALGEGLGAKGYDNQGATPDVRMGFQVNSSSGFLLMADTPAKLVEDISQRLLYGTMSDSLRNEIVQAISTIEYRSKSNPTFAQTDLTLRTRLQAALLLTVASPEFLVQR